MLTASRRHEALWRKVVDEVVQDDGRPTFADLPARGEGRAVSTRRDPFENPLLNELRRTRRDATFLPRLVTEHLQCFRDRPVVLELQALALTPMPAPLEPAVRVSCRRPSLEPRATLAERRWEGTRLTTSATWTRAGRTTWRLEVSWLEQPLALMGTSGVTTCEGAGGAGRGAAGRPARLEAR